MTDREEENTMSQQDSFNQSQEPSTQPSEGAGEAPDLVAGLSPTLFIDRSRWLRGDGNGQLLRRRDGKMCCLGFECLRRGVSPDLIAGFDMPRELDVDHKLLAGLIEGCGNDSRIARDLAGVNDRTSLSEPEREAEIIAGFWELGVAVKFVDSVPETASVSPQ